MLYKGNYIVYSAAVHPKHIDMYVDIQSEDLTLDLLILKTFSVSLSLFSFTRLIDRKSYSPGLLLLMI